MINTKIDKQLTRSVVTVAAVGFGITYLLADLVLKNQCLTAQLAKDETKFECLIDLLQDDGILKRVD